MIMSDMVLAYKILKLNWFQGEDFEDDSEFREIDEGVNETISFRDPFEVAQEQRAIENAMLASAKCYNVTSVLNVSREKFER